MLGNLVRAKRRALWSVNATSLIAACNGLWATGFAMSVVDMNAWRALVAGVTLFVVLQLSGKRIKLDSWSDYGMVMVTGGLLASHWFCYFTAMKTSGVGIGMMSHHTYPLLTVLLEPLFRKSLPRKLDSGLAIVTLVGIYIIAPKFGNNDPILQGVFWGVLSALFFSLRNILYQRTLCHYSPIHSMAWQALIAGLFLFPFVGSYTLNVTDLGAMLILGAVFTAMPHSLIASSLQVLPAKTVALLSCLMPCYGILLAWTFMGEQPEKTTLIGGGIILSVAVIESLRTKAR